MSGFSWTDEADEALKKYIADGQSFSAIAEFLNHDFPKQGKCTRNACIGKAHRRGYVNDVPRKDRPKTVAKARTFNARPNTPAPARPKMADFAKAMTGKPAAVRLRGEHAPVAPTPPAPPPKAPDGPEGGIGLFEMREGLCKFPISPMSQKGENSFDVFRACGGSTNPGAVYCAHHHSVAYQRPEKRVRKSREDNYRGVTRLPAFQLSKDWMDA